MRRAAQRDSNEPEIIDALEAAGAAVAQLTQEGAPDLLVEYGDVLRLLEVKHARANGKTVRKTSNGQEPDERGLTPAQQKWWAAWSGRPPVIVRTPAEALAAIGFKTPEAT